MVDNKTDASGIGVLSLYVIEGSVVAFILTRALALQGNAFALAATATATVVLALWAGGWPTYARMKELDADAAQRALHPGSTFRGRMPPSGAAGALWSAARYTVGALFAAERALYEKTRVVFRPPLAAAWFVAGACAVVFLPRCAPPPQAEAPVADVDPAPPPLPVETDPYACPKGTEKRGAAPPDGHELWCERDGHKDGPYRKWFDDPGERLAIQGAYVDGKRDGMWRAWYSSGARKNEGAFKDGAPDGHHLGWNEDGKKILDVTYDNGKEMR